MITAEVAGRVLNVAEVTEHGVWFPEMIAKPQQHLSFLLCANTNGIALEMPVSGQVRPTSGGCVVPVQFNNTQLSALQTLFDAGGNSDITGLVEILGKNKSTKRSLPGSSHLTSFGTMAALCACFMAAISYFQSNKQNNISAKAALIGTDAVVLESSLSGRLSYLAQDGAIRSGEVYAAVRTRSGRAVFLEASADGVLRNSGHGEGSNIVKGDRLAVVSRPSDKVYVKAYVDTATAAKLPSGYSAEIRIGEGAASHVITTASIATSNIVRGFQFSDEVGNPLSEVVLALENDPELTPGQTVTVQFRNHATGMLGLPLHEFGNWLESWTKQDGVQT